MILQYSFRKSFLISNPPLKPDQQPIQQLLPPQIPPSSLVRTYSFSKLKHNDSFKQQFNDSSIQLPKNPKLMDQMQIQIQQLKQQLKKQRQKRVNIVQEQRQLQEKYQVLLKNLKQRQKQQIIRQQKRELNKKITILQTQILTLKQQIAQKSQQLITYQSRSEQSRRLLQKLNENINKKQGKLMKEKESMGRELQEMRRGYEESVQRERGVRRELEDVRGRMEEMIERRKQEMRGQFEGRLMRVQKDWQQKLNKKDMQLKQLTNQIDQLNKVIKQLTNKIQQVKHDYQSKIQEIKNSMDQDQYTKYNAQAIIDGLRLEIQAKDGVIQKEINKNKLLQDHLNLIHKQHQREIKELQEKIDSFKTQAAQKQSVEMSKINKLQILITNYQYQTKDYQQKISFLQQDLQKINILVNQLKSDKKILHKEKQQLKTLLNQKTSQLQTLRSKFDTLNQTQIKYSSIIENYQKQQQRFYDNQSRQTSIIASMEIKIKSNAIEYQKLNLKITQKQQQINLLSKDLDKYKKLYKTEHQTLEMYKQETQNIRQKTENKWKQLKAYYENQIAVLEQRIQAQQTLTSNESRLRIRNLMTNEKARINSSRVSLTRGTPKSIQKQDVQNLAVRKRLLYKTNDPDQELKQNFWHGLNNDSLDYADQPPIKN